MATEFYVTAGSGQDTGQASQNDTEFYATDGVGAVSSFVAPLFEHDSPPPRPVTRKSALRPIAVGNRGAAPRPAAPMPPPQRVLPMTPNDRRGALNQIDMNNRASMLQKDAGGHLWKGPNNDQQPSAAPPVKYFGGFQDPRTAKFVVTPGQTLMRDGAIFDTNTVVNRWKQKSSANFVASFARTPPPPWDQGACIWVCVRQGDQAVFYSHVCKRQKFHHSTFVSGGQIIGAGEWIVLDGKLKSISATSGHYQPSLQALRNALVHLRDANAFSLDSTVLIYDRTMAKYTTIPINDFIQYKADGTYTPNHMALA